MASPLASLASRLSRTTGTSSMLCTRAVPSFTPLSAACTSVALPSSSSNSSIGSVRWATSKAGGSTKNGRDSNPKMLGVKRYGGQYVESGNIIVRQRGQKYGIVESTATVALGRDYTIYALKPGYVRFWWHAMRKKYFVEVVASPPSAPGPVEKYPIVKLQNWELPSLLSLPADTAVDEGVVARLADWIRTLNTAEKLAAVARGVPLVGGVEKVAWGEASAATAAFSTPAQGKVAAETTA